MNCVWKKFSVSNSLLAFFIILQQQCYAANGDDNHRYSNERAQCDITWKQDGWKNSDNKYVGIEGFARNLNKTDDLFMWFYMIETQQENKGPRAQSVKQKLVEHGIQNGHCGCCCYKRSYLDTLQWYMCGRDETTEKQNLCARSIWEKVFDRDNDPKNGRVMPKSVWNLCRECFCACRQGTVEMMPYSFVELVKSNSNVEDCFGRVIECLKSNRCVRRVGGWKINKNEAMATFHWVSDKDGLFDGTTWIWFDCVDNEFYKTQLFEVYIKIDSKRLGVIDGYGIHPHYGGQTVMFGENYVSVGELLR